MLLFDSCGLVDDALELEIWPLFVGLSFNFRRFFSGGADVDPNKDSSLSLPLLAFIAALESWMESNLDQIQCFLLF